jgi:hypothetical protein
MEMIKLYFIIIRKTTAESIQNIENCNIYFPVNESIHVANGYLQSK